LLTSGNESVRKGLKEHPQIFHKRVVVANQESEETSQQPGPSAERDDLLPGLAAVRVDCPLIYRLLKDTTEPQSHIEGFVVLEPEPWIPEPLILDIVGKYSARPSNGEVSSLDVVVYTPTQITR